MDNKRRKIVKDYVILEANSKIALENKVKEFMNMGYVCQGSVTHCIPVSAFFGKEIYCQAMIKKDDV
jgi:hypothetical protein